MIVAAITGNIGMGKTQALAAFEAAGAFTVNSDLVVAELLTKPDVVEKVRAILGPAVVDASGVLNKQAVANIIFSDDEIRAAYESMIHPLVIARINELVAASGAKIARVEIPLLFENGYESKFSRTITVYADENVALDRLNAAGIPREDAVRRLMCQMPIAEKISRSDFTIDNNGAPGDVIPRVRQISRVLLAQADE